MQKIKKSVIFILISIFLLTCSKEDSNVRSEVLGNKVDCNFRQEDIEGSLAFLHSKGVKKLSSFRGKVLPIGKDLLLEDIFLLRSLVLRESGIRGSDLVYLRTLKKLKELDISWNGDIGDANILYLLCLKDIERLSLVGTKISDNSLFYISGLEKIKFLSLPSTITVKGLAHLRSLGSLEVLSLFHVVSRRDFAILSRFSSLRSLSLSVVDEEEIAYVGGLKGLRRLVVPENISKDSIDIIRLKLPGCDIIKVFTQSIL